MTTMICILAKEYVLRIHTMSRPAIACFLHDERDQVAAWFGMTPAGIVSPSSTLRSVIQNAKESNGALKATDDVPYRNTDAHGTSSTTNLHFHKGAILSAFPLILFNIIYIIRTHI